MEEMIKKTEEEILVIDTELTQIEKQKEEVLARKKELTERKRKIIGALKKLREARNILENKDEKLYETGISSLDNRSFIDEKVETVEANQNIF